MDYYIIPITNSPNQNFKCSVPIDGVDTALYFFIKYNRIAGYWVMTIRDINQTILVDSLPLLTGVDLLKQYKYLEIGGAYLINMGNDAANNPTEDNLGTDYKLVWGDF